MAFKMKGIKFESDEKFYICKSKIDGKGVIASKDMKKGELIGTAVTDESKTRAEDGMFVDTRTRLGTMLNHTSSENAVQKSENNSLNVYAKKNIKKGEEITINYKNAPDYVDKNVDGYKK
tara:strand:- start:67 stop:426 length:360 start_codon:yes stop_codon:yes gene_type:complete